MNLSKTNKIVNKSLTKLVYGVVPWNLSRLKVTTESTRAYSLLRMLSEAIIDDLLVKYPDHEQVLLQAKIDIDPKFHRWFAKTFDKFADESNQEDLYSTLVRLLKDFKALTDQKRIKGADSDIERYKTVEDLQSAVEQTSQTKSKTQQSKSETDVLLRDSRFLVASPKTHAASCKLGSKTPWCISTPSNDSYWNDYTEQYELHFVMIHDKAPQAEPDGDNLHKVAVAYSEKTGKFEIYDALDYQRDVEDLQDSWGERFEEIWSLVTGSKYNVQEQAKTELTVVEIRNLMDTKDKYDFSNIKIFGGDMSILNMHQGADYPEFKKSEFDSCRFIESSGRPMSVVNSRMNRCEVRNVQNTAFIKTKFIQTNIDSSNFDRFSECTFEKSKLSNLTKSQSFTTQFPILNNCFVSVCNLGSLNMSEDQQIQGTTFQDCTFDAWFLDGKFDRCKFLNCTFDEFWLADTKFEQCQFFECTFVPTINESNSKKELLANLQKNFFMTQVPLELVEKLK
jgi:hypothetical protein